MLTAMTDVLDFVQRLEKDGRITSAQLFTTVVGDNRDTLILFGEMDQLAQLLLDDEFESHQQDGMLVMQDIKVAMWSGGAPGSLTEGLELNAEKLVDHGLI